MTQDDIRLYLRDYLIRKTSLSKSSATNKSSQASNFIKDAEIGDLVLSVNSSTIMIGRISSDFYIDNKVLDITYKSGRTVELDFNFRRKVVWAGQISRHKLPARLAKGILGQQSFYSLNEYRSEIYSLLNPFIQVDDEIIATFRIENKNDISTYHYQNLTSSALVAEFIANNSKALEKKLTNTEIDLKYKEYSRNRSSSTIKGEFSSPGFTSFNFKGPNNFELLLKILFGALIHKDSTKLLSEKDNQTIENIKNWSNERDRMPDNVIEIKPAGEGIDISKLAQTPEELRIITTGREQLKRLPRN